jgi:outer membrane lipoprotein-sorting protein
VKRIQYLITGATMVVLTIALVLTSVLVLTAAPAAAALSAEEIVAKNIEAQGGYDKLAAIESAEMTGKVMMYGMEFPFTVYQQAPNKMRVESKVQGADFIQCYDGEKGWSINPMGGSQKPQPMGAMQDLAMKYESSLQEPWFDYEKKGYTLELIGEDEVEGTPAHHLKLDSHGGVVWNLYFDTEYHLCIKKSTTYTLEENEFTQDAYLSDFKEVDGIVVPHATEQRQGDQPGQQFLIETIKYNVAIPEGKFDTPPELMKEEGDEKTDDKSTDGASTSNKDKTDK